MKTPNPDIKQLQWIRDFPLQQLVNTMHLTPTELGCFIRLYWKNSSVMPLPNEDPLLADYCMIDLEQWQSIRPKIQRLFVIDDDGWRHPDMIVELSRAQEKYEARAKAGRKGAQARWGGGSDADQ